MNEISSGFGVNQGDVPPIVLYNRQPQQFVAASSYKPDSFEKTKQDNPIIIDPNDKFVISTNSEPKELASKQMLGAKFDPKTAKKIGKELWEWGGKLWTAAEIYDTLDGYRERFNKNPDN